MSREIVCAWLQLPAEPWPPDHYALLGLAQGEGDIQRIENAVQERLEKLRRYQLCQPESVTEAMNCVARAYCCLSDPAARQAYDAQRMQASTVEDTRDQNPAADPLGWLFDSWTTTAAEEAPIPAAAEVRDWSEAPPPPRVEVAVVAEAAAAPRTEPSPPRQFTGPAIQGLGSRRNLVERIGQTRDLLRAWQDIGRHLSQTDQRLRRRIDAVQLVRQFGKIRKILAEFPPLLGQAGQPGYLVVALGRQPLIVQTFLTLLPSQREALARDWKASAQLIQEYADYLWQELRTLRQKSRWGQVFQAARCFCSQHVGLLLMTAALLVLNWHFRPAVWVVGLQLAVLVVGAAVEWLRYRSASRRAWLRRASPSTSRPRHPQPQAG